MFLNHQTKNWKIQADSASWPLCSATLWGFEGWVGCGWGHHSVSNTPPWRQLEPKACLSLTKFLKDSTDPEIYKQAFCWNDITTPKLCSHFYSWVQIWWEGCYCSTVICCPTIALLMLTKRSLLHLHSRAASSLICSQTGIPISRKQIHDFLRFTICLAISGKIKNWSSFSNTRYVA